MWNLFERCITAAETRWLAKMNVPSAQEFGASAVRTQRGVAKRKPLSSALVLRD